MRERKRIARLLITDVTLTRTDQITAQIRLSGGQHHTLTIPLPLVGGKAWQTHPDTVDLVDELLDHHIHREIAKILNERRLTSGKGKPFTELLVRDIRDNYHLTHRYQRLRDQSMLTHEVYAARVGTTAQTVKIWRRAGLIDGVPCNDKNCYLYPPPGPDAPYVAMGVNLTDRITVRQAGLSTESQRSAV
jgi:DNA-binding transcriptional regulator YiaG